MKFVTLFDYSQIIALGFFIISQLSDSTEITFDRMAAVTVQFILLAQSITVRR